MRRVTYAKAVHGQEEFDAVAKVLNEHKTIMGENVTSFEQRVAALFAKKHGIMVNSGSSANLLAAEIIGLPPGSEIITPVMTFTTTVSPLVQKGYVPVFVDAVEGTYLLDIDQVESLITQKTRALMVPSLLGNVPDFRRLRALADQHHLLLIEDSCDTIGATIDGRSTGAYTDMSTTSFYGSHIITAGGNEGMICVNRDDWAREASILRGWGRSSAVDETEDPKARYSYKLDGQPHDAKFIFERIGYNFLPNEMCAAFGLAQLAKLSSFKAKRQHNFAALATFFAQHESFFVLPKQTAGVDTAWIAFPLTIRETAPFSRMDICSYLEEHNVQTRPTFSGNLLRHPAYQRITCRTRSEGYPVADGIMRRSFLIGCHHGMEQDDLDYVMELVTDFLRQKAGSTAQARHAERMV